VIYYEIPGLSEGDELVLSYWRIKDTMLVHNIGYTQFVFDQLGAKRPLPVWTGDWKHRRLEIPDEPLVRQGQAPLLSHDGNGQLLEALSNAFMSNAGENEEHKYKLTVAVADLEFFKAKHITIDERKGNSITFTIVDFADTASRDGYLQWEGRPPAFTLPPGDTGKFTLVEGRDEDGDYVMSADGKVCHWVGEDQRGNVLKLA
jgi:hypothetical protein